MTAAELPGSHVGVQQHPRFRVSASIGLIGGAGDVHDLPLEDISLGGAFIRTTSPEPPGAFIRLRLPLGDLAATLMGKVVHVIDGATSVSKGRAPGMGVMFDGLSPDAERFVKSFVDGVVEQERQKKAVRLPVRFVDPTHVEVISLRTILQRVWDGGLEHGEIQAQGAGRVGNRVKVVIGPLALLGDVVSVEHGSARVRLVDLTPPRREAIRRFLDGTTDAIEPPREESARESGELVHALAEARRLFDGIDKKDGFAAVGLSPTATPPELRERVSELVRHFATAYPDVSAPQKARLDAGLSALVELEPDLLRHMLDAHEAAGRYPEAAVAGEALLRLKWEDAALHARVKRVVAMARANPFG